VEKGRFAAFVVIALAIWLGYIGLRIWLAPEPPAVVDKVVENKQVEKTPAGPDKAAKVEADDKPPTGEATDSAASEPKPTPTRPANERKRLTIGSLDPQSGYKMLVTLDSRGAGVERTELVDYRDLDDKHGYLGHLALSDGNEGVRINVVGPGTPAALAKPLDGNAPVGLQAGDVIVAIGGKKVAYLSDVLKTLEDTKPDDKIEIDIVRTQDGEKTNLSYEAKLTRRPLEMIQPERPHNELPGGGFELGRQAPLSMLLTFETIGRKTLKVQEEEFENIPSLLTSNWKVEEQGDDFVAFSFEVDAPAVDGEGEPTPLKVIKRYSLRKAEGAAQPGYDLDLKVEIQNLSKQPKEIAYRLDGPNGLPLEGWWYSVKLNPKMFKGAGARDIVWRRTGEHYELLGCPQLVSDARSAIEENKPVEFPLLVSGKPEAIDFAGVDCQFFSAVVMPQSPDADKPLLFTRLTALPVQDVARLDKARSKTCNVSVRMVPQAEMIQPEGKLSHDYRIFLGPKDPAVLAEYKIGSLLEYGWWYAAIPAKVLRFILDTLHTVIPNYGIAIVLLTIIVRSCMIPFSLKQAKSAALMQQLAPEMAKIKEKYADDMEKQGKAMRELYARHNFNPFGGCLLLLFQLPIFVGLYRCLSVDIELRDAPLFPGLAWASNLAGPDMLWYWKPYLNIAMITDEAHGWLGPYFNLLPLFTIGLFILQQKMFTPPATDEQTKMQQTMMTYMTVFMGIMFYKVPAGLCLYFITSSLWSVVERKLITKPRTAAAGAAAATVPATTTSTSSSGNGNSSPANKPARRPKPKRR